MLTRQVLKLTILSLAVIVLSSGCEYADKFDLAPGASTEKSFIITCYFSNGQDQVWPVPYDVVPAILSSASWTIPSGITFDHQLEITIRDIEWWKGSAQYHAPGFSIRIRKPATIVVAGDSTPGEKTILFRLPALAELASITDTKLICPDDNNFIPPDTFKVVVVNVTSR
jgi:hypothetical protein